MSQDTLADGADRRSRRILVCDCRSDVLVTSRMDATFSDYNDFLCDLRKKFSINSGQTFVLTTTDRTVLDFDTFAELQDGCTLYLLLEVNQVLPTAMEEQITFTPHYNTIIKCGIDEYYTTKGREALPYALAELIDNALSATVNNKDRRTVELRMLFDNTRGIPTIVVLDNGHGMNSKGLNNWAVYRLSKFNRKNNQLESQCQGYEPPTPTRRSLNSDISFFGVGGKQAVFFFGDSVRMISKSVTSPDVHELIVSAKEFERRERNQEDVYKGTIKNRKPGDSSHVSHNEAFLHEIIAEEVGKESFTAVVITGLKAERISYLTEEYPKWTTHLAHVYHYYIHGENGNNLSLPNSDHSNIDIQVIMQKKSSRPPCVLNLREVDTDMQTLYINTAADTFEFSISTGLDGGRVEGIIRYHPFLYDRETYPEDTFTAQDEDPENEGEVQNTTGKNRDIFECFWNGRLIPYTKISDFSWCTWSAKECCGPEECYRRISGVLFTNDKFRVTNNKLTFVDLEQRIKNKNAIFTRVVNKQEQRANIQKDFKLWLEKCHMEFDKQVKFMGVKEIITRTDVKTKIKQHPWTSFGAIEWDGKTYKKDQLVKSKKTKPFYYGKVVRFLLFGEYKKDLFATGGAVEICLEPKALHNTNKVILISQIDRTASDNDIKKKIMDDDKKRPHELKVEWPDCEPWCMNDVHPAGTPLGSLKVAILNKNGESLSRMPLSQTVIKLSVQLVVVYHVHKTEELVVEFIAQHAERWQYWFKKIEGLTKPGKYTLYLNTIIKDTRDISYGEEKLPSYSLKFTITEGSAKTFVMDTINTFQQVGVPFNISLKLKDAFGNPGKCPDLVPELKCSDLKVSHKSVERSGPTLVIRDVTALGKVNYQQSKTYNLEVTLPGLQHHTQALKISLKPGPPHSLHVKTEGDHAVVENGNAATFDVEVLDQAGNITTDSKLFVCCTVEGLPLAQCDCSCTGAGQIRTKVVEKTLSRGQPQMLEVHFKCSSVNHKNIAQVVKMLKVVPSKRVSLIKLFSQNDTNLEIKNEDRVEWPAGSSLEKLVYSLFDESGLPVPLTDKVTSEIKVNWTTHLNVEDLAQGRLPVIQVPTKVSNDFFCHVSCRTVGISFVVVPRPDEPANIRATISQKEVKLGETLSGTLTLELVDQYENPTKTLSPSCVTHMTVEAEGLDSSAVSFTWLEDSKSVQVTGLCLQAGTPGIRDIRFSYLKHETSVTIKVTAGEPAQLKLVSGPEEPLDVVNDSGISTPFLLQLYDKWDNVSTDKRVTVELKTSSPALKVKTAAISKPVNSEGRASFSVISLSGPKGPYRLLFRGLFNNKPITGPSVYLTILPNANKAVKLTVKYDTTAKLPAGGIFPVFTVTVVSDEGRPLMPSAALLSMWLWKAQSSETKPSNATELKCSKPLDDERKDCFYFRNKYIPKSAETYSIQFSVLTDTSNVLFSDKITADVVANQPVRLGPSVPPPVPVISCCTDIASRTLVNDLTLRIVDAHNNPAGRELSGGVTVSITSSQPNRSVPLFEGTKKRLLLKLEDGEVHVRRLAVVENSPGEDGSAYTLVFTPVVDSIPSLQSFELAFHFFNDKIHQQKTSGMLRKRDELQTAVDKLKEYIDNSDQLLQLFNEAFNKANNTAVDLRKSLISKKMEAPESIQDIDQLLSRIRVEAETMQSSSRRLCNIRDNFKGQQDVVGVVGHLGYVQDDDAARAISWQMKSFMDCVVTRTTESAKRIFDSTDGRQQVLPLDSIFSSPSRSLPHIRNDRMLFNPTGNPVFARDLLIYPPDNNRSELETVFTNFLKDTLLIDDLQSGTSYRREMARLKISCPTILTRDGVRVSSMGTFGGTQNRAPPMSQMSVFGAPLPPQYYALQQQADALSRYRQAVEKRQAVAKKVENQRRKVSSLDMNKKKQDLTEKTKQLEEIKALLESTSESRRKRVSTETSQCDASARKRPK
ncbi:structural maintenance of chromosomes flexible hinge domain-containing protein 1 isoform X2 [Cynoglossus semilaevis]|uniref:structural maintenance of chromosomes flexible hinge domain-containing protein 1 isoform X2 n=1 Tax=Cynoglossus semilaevis TaxID=244447 RepID=UPI0007DCAA61|nr:structural maintenance of chromosomes flexible hinge domain-containing protein 1 isoform X2 [Cynoglossus semilaevis]